MVEQNMKRKVKIWEIIAMVAIVTIIFLALLAKYQHATLLAQKAYIASIEATLADKDKREKELSAKLSSVMVLLQNAVNDLNQENQPMAINNVVPPVAASEAPVVVPGVAPAAALVVVPEVPSAAAPEAESSAKYVEKSYIFR